MRVLVSWSSGKDSALALYFLKSLGFEISGLIVTIDSSSNTTTGHRVPVGLVRLQAERLKLPLYEVRLPEDLPPIDIYESIMLEELQKIKQESRAHTIAYGDIATCNGIYSRSMVEYKKKLLDRVGMRAIYPLEGLSSIEVVKTVALLRMKALVVTVDIRRLGPLLAHQIICSTLDNEVVESLPATADIAGEGGEYHTFVVDMPGFSEPIRVRKGGVVLERWRLGWKLVCRLEDASP